MNVQLYRAKTEIHPYHFGIPVPDQVLPTDTGLFPSGLMYTAVTPTRGSKEAAGYDVYAYLPKERSVAIKPLTVEKIPTGLFLAEEALSVVLACSRSGLASKGVFLPNAPGIIDSDYRGEIMMLLTYIAPPDSPPFIITHGDRIGQLLFLSPGKVNMGVQFEEVDDLNVLRNTKRGADGFGSTGN